MTRAIHGQPGHNQATTNEGAEDVLADQPVKVCARCQQVFVQPICPFCSDLRLAVYRELDNVGRDTGSTTWAFQLSLVARAGENGSPMALAVGGFPSAEEATAHANDLVRCAVADLRSLTTAMS